MDGEDGIIAASVWVPRGAAKTNPTKIELTTEELERLVVEAKDNLDDAEAEMGEGEQTEEVEEAEDDDDNEEDNDDEDDEEVSGKQLSSVPVDDGMSAEERQAVEDEFGLDTYEDEAEGNDINNAVLGQFSGLTYYKNNEDDPYITLKEEDDVDDYRLKADDNLIAAARVDAENGLSRIEVHVYNETERSFYVHTDFLLDSFPICMEWVGMDPGSEEDQRGNLLAVGSMNPVIELWDLDVLESPEPVMTLGSASTGGKKKKKKGKAGHSGPVLGLSWNMHQRTALASCSADKTIRLWDLSTAKSIQTYTHHTQKVEVVKWNSEQQSVLVSGAHGGEVSVFDVRQPEAVASWKVSGDVESILWTPWDAASFLVGTSEGFVYECNAHNPGETTRTVQAHDSPITALTASPHIPGLVATGSIDKSVKVWDFASAPSMIASKNYDLGSVFTLSFSPDTPYQLACGGERGGLKLINVAENGAVRRRFNERGEADTMKAFERVQREEQEQKEMKQAMDAALKAEGGNDEDDEDEDNWDDIMEELKVQRMTEAPTATKSPSTSSAAKKNKKKKKKKGGK